jgi:hypothetical protein
MSLSSKMRKQKSGSYAAQAMHSTLGLPSSIGYDRGLTASLPSQIVNYNHPDAVAEYEQVIDLIAEVNDTRLIEADLNVG